MVPVGRVVDEAADMQPVRAGEMPQHVPRADLLALLGRIGKAVAEEQQVAASAQPTPRTISGPTAFATGSGSRFQAAMNSRYFGLSGLWSGIAAAGRSPKR